MSGLFGFSRQAYYQHENREFTSEEREQRVLALAEAQGTLARDEAQYKVAQLDLQRYRTLLQQDVRVSPHAVHVTYAVTR